MVPLFIMLSVVLILICVHGRVFGMLRTLRVSFFLWSATWGKILTIDNLNKRGLLLVNWFCMCWCNGETVDHLLINCEIAHTLWSEVFMIFGIHWVLPDKVASLLFGWRNWFGKRSSNVWNLVAACVIWLVWKE